MLYFYKTPIILSPEILNDGYEVHYFDNSIMPVEEVPDHYFHNKMVRRTAPIPVREFVRGDFTLALSIRDLYQFVNEWSYHVFFTDGHKKPNTLEETFNIKIWFEDYLDSKIALLENAQCHPRYFNYYEAVLLEQLKRARAEKSYLAGGVTRIDWHRFRASEAEYTWMVEDYLASMKKGLDYNYRMELDSHFIANVGAFQLLCSNMDVISDSPNVLPSKMFQYVNVFGLQDGRAPNFKYIQRCLSTYNEG